MKLVQGALECHLQFDVWNLANCIITNSTLTMQILQTLYIKARRSILDLSKILRIMPHIHQSIHHPSCSHHIFHQILQHLGFLPLAHKVVQKDTSTGGILDACWPKNQLLEICNIKKPSKNWIHKNSRPAISTNQEFPLNKKNTGLGTTLRQW